jgi:predicted dithiol-disulfide oxidoreductase (DUF899 family)
MEDCCARASTIATPDAELAALERQIQGLKAEATRLRRRRAPERIAPVTLQEIQGSIQLADLFGAHDTLILVHNMGRSCHYCTMWADGFNGLVRHLTTRSAFVVCSPDPPAEQRQFAQSRGWQFRMVSAAGTDFFNAMGFVDADGYSPGASIFERTSQGEVLRTSRIEFGPGDDFCPVWHFFDLLPAGVGSWEPRA